MIIAASALGAGGLADWLLAAGSVGAFVGTSIALVRIAIAAERRRADDWRIAAQTSAAANEVQALQVSKLLTSVEQLSTTQREMMALLQKVSSETMALLANRGPK